MDLLFIYISSYAGIITGMWILSEIRNRHLNNTADKAIDIAAKAIAEIKKQNTQ